MAGPDLAGATRAVERLMEDACIITSDPGTNDDVLDTNTGVMSDPVADSVIYEGECLIVPGGTQQRSELRGGVDAGVKWYTGLLPKESGVPARGSKLLVTESRRDPELVGKEFAIREVQVNGFLVIRQLGLELVT